MSTSIATTTLDQLAEEINQAHHEAEKALNAGLQHAFRAGELLAEAKAQCEHGTWLSWLEDNFDSSARTAQNYMKLASRRAELEAGMESNTQPVSHLGVKEALKLTAEPKDTFSEADRADLKRLEEKIKKNLPQALAWSERYEKVLTGIPQFSPDEILLGVDERTQRLIQFEPCVERPGYYHLLVFTSGIFGEGGYADYDRRGVKYTREMLAMSLIANHVAFPEELIPCPAEGHLMMPLFKHEDAIKKRPA